MEELKYQIDLLNAMNEKLRKDEKMLRLICETSNSAFLYYSYEEDRFQTVANWNHFFGFTVTCTNDLNRLYDCVEEQCIIPLREVLFIENQKLQSQSIEVKLRDKHICIEVEVNIVYDAAGNPTDKIVRFKDITKLNAQNDELTYLAYYDVLTGLYNRNYFVRLLTEYVRNAEESRSVVSVMNIDIDEFNKVNDRLGIVLGDELVQQFGIFLKDFCHDNVIACHLHSDVFSIAIYDPAGTRTTEHIYKEIRKRIKEPFHLSDGTDIRITVSVGVAEYPEASRSALELINYAELVVYRVKAQGSNGIQYFNAPILDDFMSTVELESKLKQAVTNKDFVMFYQPQYYTGSRRLRGVEALVRWKNQNGELISPGTFIPVAEKNGSIVPIGKWVVEESIKQYANWRNQFGFPFVMSINISALQYKKEDFVDFLMNVLNQYQISPSEIELEITESVLIDDFAAVSEKLKLLRNYGIRISLDDFGTGFSSLSYLKKLPIDTLKIDKTFIDTVMTDPSTRVITESILNMVKALGIESIAEGVEEEQQYKYLNAIGCDIIQGYLFSKPLPPVEVERIFAGSLV